MQALYDPARQLSQERFEMTLPVYSWHNRPARRSLSRPSWRALQITTELAKKARNRLESGLLVVMLAVLLGAHYLLA